VSVASGPSSRADRPAPVGLWRGRGCSIIAVPHVAGPAPGRRAGADPMNSRSTARVPRSLALAAGLAAVLAGAALPPGAGAAGEPYAIQPGDLLEISVWKEPDLVREVLVRPDGGLSFPLAGDVAGAGRTVEALRAEISERLARFIPDPVVTVAVKRIQGNAVYVIGKVNNPGQFILGRGVDVMQALSMAGGMTTFASANSIKILRRTASGQVAIPFRYEDVVQGRDLEQNVILEVGDVVVVP